jgi:hypothetical protein
VTPVLLVLAASQDVESGSYYTEKTVMPCGAPKGAMFSVIVVVYFLRQIKNHRNKVYSHRHAYMYACIGSSNRIHKTPNHSVMCAVVS